MFVALTPLVIPLLTAIFALFARRSRPLQHQVALMGAAGGVACTAALFYRVWTQGPIVVGMSGWPAPFGIMVVVDTLSASLTLTTSLVHLAITGHGLASSDEDRRRSDFWPLANTMVMGVQGAFITGDVFNLYVWFEVLLLSSFVLVALGNTRPQVEAASKYVVLNLLSSVMFLLGIALLYGSTGTLTLADLARAVREPGQVQYLPFIAVLFVAGFGLKAAMFPFSTWIPSAYGAPPATLAALLAGLLTKVGIYSFLRVGTLLFHGPVEGFGELLLGGAIVSIIIGAIGTMAQLRLRGIIVHTVVFAVGFMLLGLGVGTAQSLEATIAYLISDMLVVTALVLYGGEVERITGETDLAGMGGIYRDHPFLALGFLATAFSVAGFPPLIGFWGKVALLMALIEDGHIVLTLTALLGSAVVLVAVGLAWSRGLWKPAPKPPVDPGMERGRIIPLGLLSLLILGFSFNPQPLFKVAHRAATELIDVEGYIQRVMP